MSVWSSTEDHPFGQRYGVGHPEIQKLCLVCPLDGGGGILSMPTVCGRWVGHEIHERISGTPFPQSPAGDSVLTSPGIRRSSRGSYHVSENADPSFSQWANSP